METKAVGVSNKKLSQDAAKMVDYTDVDANFASSIREYNYSIKKTVLSLSSQGNFEKAKQELKYYDEEHKKVPGFTRRTKHYFRHCHEVLDAIENLKHIPNFNNLRPAQQKQIREKVKTYAEDLSSILGRIDKVLNDLKIQDVRSTVWVARTFSACFFSLIALIALKEAYYTLPSVHGAFEQYMQSLFQLMGL